MPLGRPTQCAMTHLFVSNPWPSKISVQRWPGWSESTNAIWSGVSDACDWTQMSSAPFASSPNAFRSSGVHVGMKRGTTQGWTRRPRPAAPGCAARTYSTHSFVPASAASVVSS